MSKEDLDTIELAEYYVLNGDEQQMEASINVLKHFYTLLFD